MIYRLVTVCVVLLLAAGCVEQTDTSAPAPDDHRGPGPMENPDLPDDRFSATGAIDLMFYDQRPAEEGPRRPTFKVTTPSTTIVEGGRVAFRDAEAVIYGPDEIETRLHAGYGEFDQETRQAVLSEGVSLVTETMRAELEDVIWRNEDRTARSENPVVILDADSRLEAQSFVFYPEEERLQLTGVTGAVTIPVDEDDEDNGSSGEGDMPAFARMRIVQAPEVRMVEGRFESISGGVELQMEPADPEGEPFVLTAAGALFTYTVDSGPLPDQVALQGGVRVAGSPGIIESDTATMELASRRFFFESNVRGSSPQVEDFRADRLTYEPGLIVLSGSVRVTSPQGNVTADRAELQPEIGEMVFDGAVDMTSDEGRIQANRVELDETRGVTVFTGNVRGSMGGIEDFNASRIVHSMASGDADLYDVRVRRLELGPPPADGADDPMAFQRMAIERAPRVVLASQRVQRITCGVDFSFHGVGDTAPPMRVQAAEARFDYDENSGALPSQVQLLGGVTVDGPLGRIVADEARLRPAERRFVFTDSVHGSTPDIRHFAANSLTYEADHILLEGDVAVEHAEGDIRSNRAEVDTVTRHMVFTGEVRGSMPQVQGLTAERLRFDPETETIELERATIDRFGDEAPQPVLLDDSDILDWAALLDRIQDEAVRDEPHPGRRIMSLIPPQLAQGLEQRPRGTQPDEATQQVILREMNHLLARWDLYDAPAWRGISLDAETAELTGRDPAGLTDAEIVRRNRGLLAAAYPDLIAVQDNDR